MPGINFSESELVRLLQAGDKDAFSVLFKQYYAPLCDYAAAILKFPEIAEEVVQVTFIRIWENRQNITIDFSLRAYLYRSIHNNCIEYYRSLSIHEKHNKAITDEITYHSSIVTRGLAGNALESIITGELEKFLNHTIDSLPEQCNKVFCLSRYEQLSYKEIAERLDISVNTVKTQLSRAFSKLREACKYFENK